MGVIYEHNMHSMDAYTICKCYISVAMCVGCDDKANHVDTNIGTDRFVAMVFWYMICRGRCVSMIAGYVCMVVGVTYGDTGYICMYIYIYIYIYAYICVYIYVYI